MASTRPQKAHRPSFADGPLRKRARMRAREAAGRQQMSQGSKFTQHFASHHVLTLRTKPGPAGSGGLPGPVGDMRILVVAVDAVFSLYRRFTDWRSRRRTFRALSRLDERQLRDIGVTRDEVVAGRPLTKSRTHKSLRALAELDDTQISNLSERGLQLRREIRRRR